MALKSRKPNLIELKNKLSEEYPIVYELYMKCVEGNRREVGSMVEFARKIGAPEPVIGTKISDYLNEIWPYIERYKP